MENDTKNKDDRIINDQIINNLENSEIQVITQLIRAIVNVR